MKPQRAPDIREDHVSGELILYHPVSAQVIYLNPEAAVVWGLVDGQRTAAEICNLVEDAYAQDRCLTEDVKATLIRLQEFGAIYFVTG
mgnify:CR=1 FL=1